MYHNFFGLNEQAFSIAVNPRYLYMSDQHREALAHLVYGIQVGGFVLLTGEVGTGKTTIIRCLLEQLPEDTDIAIVLNPMASAPELLSIICDELGVRYLADKVTIKDLVDSLHEYLLQSHMKGRKTVLLIDEAQLLKPNVLEQIRLLTNLETTTEKLLQIILVGQPELKTLLARPSLRQLSQRITARFHLEALSLAETQAYISHRLAIAGMPAHLNPFPPGIVKKVHEFSGGVPRLINILCERMLLGAYGKNQTVVDQTVLRQAVTEVLGQQPDLAGMRLPASGWRLGIIVGLLILLAGSFFLGRKTSEVEVQGEIPIPVATRVDSLHSLQSSSQSASLPASASSVPGTKSVLDAPEQVETAESAVPEVPQPVESAVTWERDMALGQRALFGYLAIAPGTDPCIPKGEYVCEKPQLGTWNELREINRPALLTLVTSDKKLAYVTLIGLSEDSALVLDGGQRRLVDWPALAPLWNGNVFYLWRRPPGFERPAVLGDKGRLVVWLAQQFAILDQQREPLTRDSFTQVMKKRVEIFQASQQLEPDGIAGAQTLRRLNEVLGIDTLLVDPEAGIQAQPPGGAE